MFCVDALFLQRHTQLVHSVRGAGSHLAQTTHGPIVKMQRNSVASRNDMAEGTIELGIYAVHGQLLSFRSTAMYSHHSHPSHPKRNKMACGKQTGSEEKKKKHQWTSLVDIFLDPPQHTTSVATMRIRRSCQHSSGSFQVDDIARLKDRTPATFHGTQHSPNWKYLETKTWKEASLLVSKIFGNDFQPLLCRNAWPPSAKHTWHQSETYLNPNLITGTSNQQKSKTS